MIEIDVTNSWANIFTLPCHALENITFGVDSFLTDVAESPILFNDLWIIPSHVGRNHWVLFLALLREKIILILDPLYQQGTISNNVQEHLQVTSHQNCFCICCIVYQDLVGNWQLHFTVSDFKIFYWLQPSPCPQWCVSQLGWVENLCTYWLSTPKKWIWLRGICMHLDIFNLQWDKIREWKLHIWAVTAYQKVDKSQNRCRIRGASH